MLFLRQIVGGAAALPSPTWSAEDHETLSGCLDVRRMDPVVRPPIHRS